MASLEDYDLETDQIVLIYDHERCEEALSWKLKVQPALKQSYKQFWYNTPSPNLNTFSNSHIDFTDAYDVCSFVAGIWELVHTGMNGLRYGHHIFTPTKWTVYNREVGSAHSEDLSSISLWLDGDDVTIGKIRSYWFTRTFTNCSTIAKGMFLALQLLRETSNTISCRGISFDVSSAEISGYSVMKRDGCEFFTLHGNMTETNAPSPEAHRVFESHNHVVISIQEVETREKFIIDLAGSQFGIFGDDVKRPHIVIQPYNEWKRHFKHIEPTRPEFSYQSKIDQFEAVLRMLMKERLVIHKKMIKKRLTESTSKTIHSTPKSDIDMATSITNAKLAEAELYAMLEKEEKEDKLNKKKGNKPNTKNKK